MSINTDVLESCIKLRLDKGYDDSHIIEQFVKTYGYDQHAVVQILERYKPKLAPKPVEVKEAVEKTDTQKSMFIQFQNMYFKAEEPSLTPKIETAEVEEGFELVTKEDKKGDKVKL